MTRRACAALLLASACLLLDARPLLAATTFIKDPDVGPYWYPLKPGEGSFVYANSFVAPAYGAVTSLGTWLFDPDARGGADVRFQVLDSLNGDPLLGPDVAHVLATTDALRADATLLTFYGAPTIGASAALEAGKRYWFAANVIGLSGPGALQAGGHTQNTDGILDDGTFWVSNAPNGSYFLQFTDPHHFPRIEMPFSVVVPEPATAFLPGVSLVGVAVFRRRPTSA